VAVFSGLTAGEADRGERTAELEPVLPVLAKALQKFAQAQSMASAVVAELHFERAQTGAGFVSDTAAPNREQQLLELIDSTLRDDGFMLHLQPSASFNDDDEQLIVDVRIRLPMQEFGFLSSQEFQRTAERNGRMPAIDRWMVRALLVWMRRNRDCWADVNVIFSVNLSARSVLRPDFRIYLEQCLDKSGLPLGALRFDIGGLDNDIVPPECAELTRSLIKRGCQVSLDNTPSDTGRFDVVDANVRCPLAAEARA
jgi:predicted signal transduction protein with EAL and GGDEF domain